MRNAKKIIQEKIQEINYLTDFKNEISLVSFNDSLNPYEDVELYNITVSYTIHYSNDTTKTFDSYDTLLAYLNGCIDGVRAVDKKEV